MEFKSIDDLSKKMAVQGTEKIPVSSTEYVDTEQIKEYVVDEVNAALILKADSIDLVEVKQSISTLENVLSDANINQESQVATSGVDTVLLPKTAANTGMQVQLFGQSAQNLVVNGDFRNGTTGWTPIGGSTSVANSILSVLGSGASANPRVVQGGNLTTGNVFYAAIRFRVTNNVCSSLRLGHASGSILFVSKSLPVQNEWYNSSGRAVVNGTDTRLMISSEYESPEIASGKVMEVDYAYAINLTATFGAGNEPTKEQCDLLFANYFEGSDNVLGTGRVRSVGKNLIDSSKDRKNIYTGQTDGLTDEQRYVFYDIIIGGTRNLSTIRTNNINEYSIEGDKVIVSNTAGGYGVTFKFKAIAGKRYYKSAVLSSGVNGVGIGIFDKLGNLLANSKTAYVDAPANSSFGVLCLTSDTYNTDITYTNVGVFETSLPAIYEPYRESILQLTTPELRSNGLIKDEIRKGTNGYELVKRVGVGTLGVNGIAGGDFEGGLIGAKTDSGGVISTWALNTVNPISGTQDGRLQVTTIGTVINRPLINFSTIGRDNGQLRKLSFSYKVNSGIAIIASYHRGGSIPTINQTLSGSGVYSIYYLCDGTSNLYLYFNGTNLFDIQLDNIKDELINIPDGGADGSAATVIGSNIHYTLATPVITPISHAGLLNSNSNGTAYFEPIIADAGVYSSNLTIQLTDYPISSFESIRKYANGTYTELNPATAVITSGGLSFTHPDLVSGDLVMFTYAYNRESIGRSMTLTYFDTIYEKLTNKQNSLAVDGTGTKYPTVDAVNAAIDERVLKTSIVGERSQSTTTVPSSKLLDDELTALQPKSITPIEGMTAATVEDGLGELNNGKANKIAIEYLIKSEWKLPATIGVKDGKLIALTGIPATNTEIAFYKKCTNVWGIIAEIKSSGAQPYYLNAGLILSETTDNKQFRMLKSIIHSAGSDEYVYYTRNNSAWLDKKSVIGTNTPLIARDEKLALFLSGDTAQCYRDDALQYHKKTESLPADSRHKLYAGIIFNIEGNTVESYNVIERPTPYAHFSVDDVGAVMKTVTDNSNTMTSIFENSFFAFWKTQHDAYGVVVTFNLYYSINSGTWNLSMMTDKFKTELSANSSWLKFAFHGGDETIQYTDPINNASCLDSYASTMTQIVRFASYANVDRFPRLTFFSGNKDLLIALKNTGMFVGCFTADDTRTANCGLNTVERDCVNASSDYVDIENELYYIRSSARLDSPTEEKKAALIAEMDLNSRNVVFEYFNHGGQHQIISDIAIELNKRKIRYDFPQNNLPF